MRGGASVSLGNAGASDGAAELRLCEVSGVGVAPLRSYRQEFDMRLVFFSTYRGYDLREIWVLTADVL